MDRSDILAQLLAMAFNDIPKSGAIAGNTYRNDDDINNQRYVAEYRGSAPFFYGVHAGLFLSLHILRLCEEMERNACPTRNRWTIQEPTFTDADGVHPSVVVDNPTTQWFIAGSEEKCPGGP